METSNLSPEQIAMQEKLKNMSPEEIAEFQKKNCIFCQIISGKVQSRKIYEDPKCLAILDINPSNPGHVLLLPKEHYAIMPQMPDDITGHIFMVAKSISNIMLKTLKVTGTTIFVANGIAAGQKAQHFMLHIIPRKEGDGMDILNIPQRQINDSDMSEVHKRLLERVNLAFGIKQENTEEHIADLKEVAEEKKEETKAPKEESKKEEPQPEEKTEEEEIHPAEEAEEEKEETETSEEDAEEEKDEGEEEPEEEEDEEKDPNLDDIARLLR